MKIQLPWIVVHAALLASVLLACGDDAAGRPDANAPPDSGTPRSGDGGEVDAGLRDASGDAATAPDAATPPDAATAPDAATPPTRPVVILGTPCERACRTVEELDCPEQDYDVCLTRCEVALTAPCGPWFQSLNVCAAAQPSSSYSCNDRGVSELRAGLCQDELDSVTRCLRHGPAGPPSVTHCEGPLPWYVPSTWARRAVFFGVTGEAGSCPEPDGDWSVRQDETGCYYTWPGDTDAALCGLPNDSGRSPVSWLQPYVAPADCATDAYPESWRGHYNFIGAKRGAGGCPEAGEGWRRGDLSSIGFCTYGWEGSGEVNYCLLPSEDGRAATDWLEPDV